MTQKNIKLFINEVCSKPLKKNYAPNKTDVYHIHDNWRMGILDLKDYGPGNNKEHRYVLVVKDNFSKFGWTVPLKNKKAEIMKDSFEKNFISSKRKPNSIESDRGKEFSNSLFRNFLNKNSIKLHSTYSSHGAVFAELFHRTNRDLLKRLVFEKGDGKWIDVLLTIIKKI